MTDKNKTYLCVIADRSGSMSAIVSDMEPAIKNLLREQAKEPGELHVDVVRFDTEVEVLFEDVRADDVKRQIIEPRGMTALNDALGQTIVRLGEKFAEMDEDERPGTVIVAVVTDGYENSSREYSTDQVKALVEKQKAEFAWNFMFLGTGIDSFAVAGGYGIRHGETISFAPSAAGMANVTFAANGYASTLRANTSRGLSNEDVEFDEDARAAAMEQ